MNTKERIQAAMQAVESGTSIRGACKEFDVPKTTLRRRIAEINERKPKVDKPVPKSRSLEQLLNDRRGTSARMLAHADAVRRIRIDIPTKSEAYGLAIFGDPHLDDDGCNFLRLEKDLKTCDATANIYGVNIGDLTNNWVGMLQRKYADQTTTRGDAVKLAQWFINRPWWAAHISGNHDAWNFGKEMLGLQINSTQAIYAENGDLKAAFRCGGVDMFAHFRHDFKGQSQYNTVFGPVKAAYFGNDDHLLVQGHRHVSGETTVYHDKTKTLSRCLAVGTYKEHDSYAIEGGFRQSNYAPSFLVIVQPKLKGRNGFVRPFDDLQEGAEYLNFLNS